VHRCEHPASFNGSIFVCYIPEHKAAKQLCRPNFNTFPDIGIKSYPLQETEKESVCKKPYLGGTRHSAVLTQGKDSKRLF
jgi:hypothetical protein